jgi:predicted GNAT family acetyltransferase
MDGAIEHDREEREFFTHVEGLRPVLQYRLVGAHMHIVHTAVPAPVANRGIGAQLMRAALHFAREQGRQVEPSCSFARAFLQRHAEYADLWRPAA